MQNSTHCIHPHCIGGKRSKFFPTEVSELGEKNSPYVEVAKKYYSAANGQLKLFSMTLEFLTDVVKPDKKYLVVYPGSAPGDNISPMVALFPNVSWYLVDPRKFHKSLYSSKSVLHIESSFFEPRHIEEINMMEGFELLFISDIRNMEDVPFEKRENNIAEDMRMQESWVRQLDPVYSQLKFRLPRTMDKFPFFNGSLRIQMFAPHTSSETRLVVSQTDIDSPNLNYDVKEYDNAMHKFNHNVRNNLFRNADPKEMFDGCYDCTSFVLLVKKYNEVWGKNYTPEQMAMRVPDAMSKHKYNMAKTRKMFCKKRAKSPAGPNKVIIVGK